MRTTILPLAFLGALIVLIGCAKNPGAPARVSGTISYKGTPIKGGTMKFYTQEGVGYDAQITNDGTYTATDLPEGEMIVTVETESINPAAKGSTDKNAEKRMAAMTGGREPPAGMGGSPKAMNVYIKVPEKFGNPKTSPVTVTLSAGRQVKNIDLTD